MAALGSSIWDDYEQNQYGGGSALDAAKASAQGNPTPPVVTSGNAAWRAAQGGQPQPNPTPYPTPQPTPQPQPTQPNQPSDPVDAAQKRFMSRFTFPAVNQFGPAGMTASNVALPFANPQRSQYQPGTGASIGATAGNLFQNPYADMFAPQQQQPQLPSGVQPFIGPDEAKKNNLQWTGGSTGYQPYLSPQQMTEQNLTYTGGPSPGSANEIPSTTIHFLPPGFTANTGSTGVPGSTPNDVHFLPPGFNSVQGITNPQSKQLQSVQRPSGGLGDILEQMMKDQTGGY